MRLDDMKNLYGMRTPLKHGAARRLRFIRRGPGSILWRKRMASILAFCGLLCAWLLVFSATAYSQGQKVPVRIQTELLTVRTIGVQPRQITRPKGPFYLLVENRSGLEEINLQITRITGEQQHSVRIPKRKRMTPNLLDLTPGQYVLTELSHPDWLCAITITAH
jgi:hypothetical protein